MLTLSFISITAIIRDVVKQRAAAYFKLEESQNEAERIASAAQSVVDQEEKTAEGAAAQEKPAEESEVSTPI